MRHRSLALFALALLLPMGSATASARSRRPNIVVIMLDDLRWDAVDGTHGLNGAPVLPGVLQELAAEGVTFTNAYVTTALCAPSRASFLSGQYARTHGLRGNGYEQFWAVQKGALESNLLPVWLQRAGYRTALVGKYSNGYKFDAEHAPYVPPGWSDWHALTGQGQYERFGLCESEDGSPLNCQTPPGYSTYVLRDRAVAFIEKATHPLETKPFFLLFTPKTVHGEGGNKRAKPECFDRCAYRDVAAWRPPSYDEPEFTDKPLWLRDNVAALSPAEQCNLDVVRQLALESSRAVAGPEAPTSAPWPCAFTECSSPSPSPSPTPCVSPPPVSTPPPDSCNSERTRTIQAIVKALRDGAAYRDTVIIFTSDNGFIWGEHRLDSKTAPYEEAIRVPLVIRPARGTTGRTESSLVLNMDLTATIADLANAAPLLPEQAGHSLVPFLDGVPPAEPWRNDFFIEAWDEGDGTLAFTGVKSAVHGKYIEYQNGEREYYAPGDVHELQNVIANPPNQGALDALTDLLREGRPPEPPDMIFASSFELGNLTRWSIAPTHPELVVAHEAALVGDPATAHGLKVGVYKDTPLSIQDDTPEDAPQYRAKFHFDPNGVVTGATSTDQELTLFIAGEAPPENPPPGEDKPRRLVTIVLKKAGGTYELLGRVRKGDDSTRDFGPFCITDAPHHVEFEWRKAAATDPPDGYFRIWIDGRDPDPTPDPQPPFSKAGDINTGDHEVDFGRLGAISVRLGASGTLYFDGFVSRRQFSLGE